MDQNKLFHSKQLGFRSKLIPINTLSGITEKIWDNSNALYFADLQNAFDTKNHEYLLNKFDANSVSGVCLDWFTSSLSERS